MRTLFGLALVVSLMVCGQAQAGWGDLKVTFTYGGKAPTPKAVNVTKDKAVCEPHKPIEEELLVNSQNSGLQNVIVYLYSRTTPKIHPDYQKLAATPLEFDNHKCRFEPHVALLWNKRTLKLGNKDPIGHNTKIDTISNPPINPLIPANATFDKSFSQEERLPSGVSCSIHPWMKGWVVIKDHPYMGLSNENGELEIKNLPDGKLTFQVWHEKAGYVRDVTVGGKKTEWKKGRVDVTIGDGKATDLGKVVLAPAAFE